MKYFDEEDAITEYEKQLQKKDKEIKRLKEEYMILQNASDKVEEAQDREIERLKNIINEIEKDIKNLYTYGIKNNAEQKDYLLNRLEGLKEYRGSDKE